MSNGEILAERYGLVLERIRGIPGEKVGDERLEAYFSFCARFLLMIDDTVEFLARSGPEKAGLAELAARNRALYADILPGHYGESYGNPSYAVRELGEELGALLSALYAELRSLIGFVYEGRLEELVIRMELFVEIYASFVYAADQGRRPSAGEVREAIYWFAGDYAEAAALRRLEGQVEEDGFGLRKIMESDLTDLRYLYGYGEYVGPEQLERARHLAELPQESIAAMAGDWMKKCLGGMEAAGGNLSGKGILTLGFRLGSERVLRCAVAYFERMGIRCACPRAACSVLDDRGAGRSVDKGFCGGIPNPQFECDHRADKAIFLDKNYVNRKLEAARAACERWRERLKVWAGPAIPKCAEAQNPQLVPCGDAIGLSGEQKRLWTEYESRAGALLREYMPVPERAFRG
ncbi:MAG: hypothetical protein HFH96_02505 [Lachnospiraceae bacterium]|jgi:aminopeptidase|nr:hypothetical protein [uncultured Acetatifactor sp.]MCI9229978.1 hypothetical protein [Lachnospiraceae bacterium]